MVSSVSSDSAYIPTIPGITGVLGSISATAAYASIEATGQTKELALVAKAPQVATETAYFKSAISKMTTVNQLLADPRALSYLMTAYGLGSDTAQMGIIKQVLTQDPTNTNSLVNQLAAPQWKTMATDLQTFATGLNTLKGTTTSQTFSVQALSNQYLQVQQPGSTTYNVNGDSTTIDSTTNLFASSLSGLTVSSGGVLQTSEGYKVMGIPLDNQGNILPPAGATLVDATATVPNSSGTQTPVKESFSNQGNGNWQWTVTDNSGNILSQQTLALTFNPDGTLSTINGNPAQSADGTSPATTTLNWSGGTTTSQSFDLGQAFTAGFNQYQTDSDLRTVQLNWFNNSSTPTTTITPYAALNGSQPVDDPNSYTSVESVQSNDTSNGGTPTYDAVTQTLTKNNDGTWNWNITGSDGTVLYSQNNVNLTFNSNGALTAVNGNTNTSPSVNLTFADGTTTSQTFDLATLTDRSDFSQTVSVTDNIGTSRNIRLDYTKTNDTANSWQVQIWNADTNTLASTVDFSFNADGSVQSVGQYDSATGQITDSNNNPYATSQNFSINWGAGYGSSTISLDLSNLTDLSSVNTQSQATATNSVALGKYQSASIDQNGTVSAVYAKADGSGNVTIPISRLAVNQFGNSAGLSQYNGTSYYAATPASGSDTLQPLGTDTDASGNPVANEAGQLAAAPTTVTGQNTIDKITSGYDNYIYQEALGKENQALRYAVYFKQTAPTLTSVDALLGDGPSRDVVSTVFGIPQTVAEQDLNEQEKLFSAAVNVKNFQSPTYVDNIIQRFLAVSDASNTGTTASSPLSSLLGSSSSDSVDAGSVLSTVTSNINILA